jgi:hypothetical protein
VSIACNSLDAYVAEEFLTMWGDHPEYVRRAQVTGAAELEAAERAVDDALHALGTSATPEAFQALQDAQKRREEALAVPQQAVVRVVPSGRTVRQAWEEGDVHARRDLLAANYADIIVRPGKRGAPGVQPDRIIMIMQPTYVADVSLIEGFRHGATVVDE